MDIGRIELGSYFKFVLINDYEDTLEGTAHISNGQAFCVVEPNKRFLEDNPTSFIVSEDIFKSHLYYNDEYNCVCYGR